MTTETATLAIPDLALALWSKPHGVMLTDEEVADHIRSIAAPVVAAELRRLAADCHETALVLRGEAGFTVTAEVDALEGVVRTLRARADELDPS